MATPIVARTEPVDAEFVKRLNKAITRSGRLNPGRLRGVRTRHGVHEPPTLTDHALREIVDRAARGDDPAQNAIDLFVALAKA